jgi:outer membrane receptor protein involved in Fe transport
LTDFDYKPVGTSGFYASKSNDKITNQYFETRARFVPKSKSDADVTAGYSYMKQKYDVFNTVNLGSTTYDIIHANGTNNSLFANGRFPVNQDGLSLISGLRYEQAERFGQNGPSDFRTGADVVTPLTVKSNQLTWKLGVSNILSNGGDLYSHIATGWRPSAVNYYSDSYNSGNRTVEKEKSLTYEAGYRHFTSARYIAAAIFLTKVTDYQETKAGTNPGTGYLANVAKVDIPGFEIEAKQALTKAVNLFGGVGYTRARYGSYPEFTNLEGKALGNRPDWNMHVGTEYKEGRMTYAATVVGTDSFNSAYTSSGATTKVDGHFIGNLRATYQEKAYSVSAFINNVANKEYFLNAGYYNYGSSQPRGQVGLPRTIGVKLKADF